MIGLEMMAGGRNGRHCKWVFLVILLLSLAYVFYLYRDVRSALLEKKDQIEHLDSLHSQMTEQLRELVQGHSQLQEDVKSERVAHQRTRMDKDSLGKKCQVDLKEIKEFADEEKLQLEQERDNYKNQLVEEKENIQRLQVQQDTLASRYNHDMTKCAKDKQDLEEKCEQEKDECERKVNVLRQQAVEAQASVQRIEVTYGQCTSQLMNVQEAAQLKGNRVSSLEAELSGCQKERDMMRLQKEQWQSEMRDLQTQKHEVPAAQSLSQNQEAAEGKRMPDAQKAALFTRLTDKMMRGEQLNDQEKKVLHLLEKDYGDPGQGINKFKNPSPRVNQGSKHSQAPSVSEQGGGFRQSQRLPGGGMQLPDNGNRAQFGYQATNQQWQRRVGGGMEHGQEREHGGMGAGLNTAGEKQQLPELADQEEVKALQLDEQELVHQGENEGKREGGGGADEPKEVKEGGGVGGEEGEEGHLNYNPREIRGKKDTENFNLPSPMVAVDNKPNKQPMPVPDRVREEPEMVLDVNNIRPPPKFENPDRAFDEENKEEEEELEREQEDNGDEVDNGNKNDDNGRKQFEDDLNFDVQERVRMVKARKDRWGPEFPRGADGSPHMPQKQGDRQIGREGVEEAMKEEIDDSRHRRREVVDSMEKIQQDELKRRLKEQGIGQRGHNLR